MPEHTVYAIASGKGGVGKTATTVNLGASLAEAGYTVAVVDADLGMANLGPHLGLAPDGATLHEVLAGEASLDEATYETMGGLAVVPSGTSLDGYADVDTAALSDAVGALREAFDYVLVDLGAGLSHDSVLPLVLADAVVLVSTPHPLAVQDTAKTRELADRLGGQVAGAVLTRATDPATLDVDAISDDLEMPVMAVVPEDETVPESATAGEVLLEYAPDSPATAGYRGLARIVEAESLDAAPIVPEVPDAPDGVSPDAAGAPPEQTEDREQPETGPDVVEGESGAGRAAGESGTGGDGAAESPHPGGAPATADGADDSPAAEADDDSPAAAEIAAAIEEAAGGGGDAAGTGATGTGAAGTTGGSERAGDAAASAVDASGAAGDASGGADGAGSEAGDAGGGADGAGSEAGDAGGEAGDAGAATGEGGEEEGDEETDPVDELFSVEGADPDEDGEDDEESSGLFGRFLG